jgi:spermidine synthase
MYRLIYLVFFLSGCAALIFEALWFRQAGLAFGNSMWSATLVLSGFMGGLALGNGLMIRFGQRLSRPISAYVVLEILIASVGLLVVFILPGFGAWLAPLFRPFMDNPALLNFLRLMIAFALLMVPATAMGATLPLLVKALSRRDDNYGRVLGRLYGWNTMGAMLGVLTTELFFIRWFGVYGTGVTAALISLLAVFVALHVSKTSQVFNTSPAAGESGSDSVRSSLTARGKRILAAAFFAGATLLGLEVLWFRFLLLFQPGTSLVFAVMLATVLCGIALGGIVTAWLYSRNIIVHRYLRMLACISAILITASYAIFPWVQASLLLDFGETGFQGGFVVAAIILMLPVSIASGAIFTMLGRGLKEEIGNGTRATAWLTLFNTIGAMLGSLTVGFVLLPTYGIEKCFFIMIALYGLIALLIPRTEQAQGLRSLARRAPVVAIFVLSVAFFPFGLMKDTFLGTVLAQRFPNTTVAAMREGLTETAIYLEYQHLGQPYIHRLLTNSYSMSATNEHSMRYMKLFVYLPVAISRNPKNALLISYGLGVTAKALTDTSSLESIDIVDISRNILALSEIVYPDPDNLPINDERVNVHVEDGRFFLQMTEKKYDLITAEPPPPTVAGVVNLYTQEYFGLIHDRLTPGGMTSYWLPGHSLEEKATKAIIKAFCNVFEDCSLWAGAGLDWILLGSRDAPGTSGEKAISRQWKDPLVADELRAIGVENPAQLGALFMADAEDLRHLTQDVAPVVDAFPYRIQLPYSAGRPFPPAYAWLMDTNRAQKRFTESTFIKQHWPVELVAESLPYFYYQRLINRKFSPGLDRNPPFSKDDLRRVLVDTGLESLPLWMMGSNYYEQRLLENVATDAQYTQAYEWGLAKRDIAERRYTEAMQRLERLRAETDPANRVRLDRLHSLAASLKDY